MKVLLVPDSMKDSLSAIEAAKLMKGAIRDVFPLAEVVSCPLSDGGEGLIEVLLEAGLGSRQSLMVEDPLGRMVHASVLALEDHVYVIEMAQAAGLDLLTSAERNPMNTSTRGVGQMIKHVISLGAKKIYLGLGGSATHDLGCGMAQALGLKFYDSAGALLDPMGRNLADVSTIDFTEALDLGEITFIGITDVQTLLCGAHGAAHTYGPQKGATKEEVDLLERGTLHVIEALQGMKRKTAESIKGSAAAGGLGFGLVTFLQGTLVMGLDVVGELMSLKEKLKACDLVMTLEGKTDEQTWEGKLPYSVALWAKEFQKPVLHFTGSWNRALDQLANGVFDVVIPIQDRPMSQQDSVNDAAVLLKNAVRRSFQLMSIMSIINRKA
jgi:glycerate 2-kinase